MCELSTWIIENSKKYNTFWAHSFMECENEKNGTCNVAQDYSI